MATKTSTMTARLIVEGQTVISGATIFEGSNTRSSTVQNDNPTYTNGAGGANTVDLVAYVKDTITPGSPSTPVTHDLETMTDFNNETVDFANLRVIASQVQSGPAGVEVIIGDSGADALEDAFMNGTTPAVVVPLDGCFFISNPVGSAGWSVTTNETDLKFDGGTFATTNLVVETIYGGND